MNFIDLIYQHNLESLSTPMIIQAYKSLINGKKERFMQQLVQLLENDDDHSIVVNGKIIDGASLKQFMDGMRDDVLSWGPEGSITLTDVDDQIQEELEEFSVLSNFLDSLSVQANSAIDRVTYFVNSMQLEDITSNGALSLFDYYKDILLNTTSVNGALDVLMGDISSPATTFDEGSQAFRATGVNPFFIMLNNIDFPEINISNIFEIMVSTSELVKTVKTAARLAAAKAIKTGIDKINTTFVDTIDFEIKSDFDDLSCDQSTILLDESTMIVSAPVNENSVYYNVIKQVKLKEDAGYTTFSYAIPTIGATFYFIGYRYEPYHWSTKVFLKKHIYSSSYSSLLVSTLLDCISRNVGAANTISALSAVINGSSPLPDTYEGSIAEGRQFLATRTTESLIMLGFILLRYGTDNASCYQKLVEWYRQDDYGNFPAQYAFRIDYGSQGVPSTITNSTWYDEVNYISDSITRSLKLDMVNAVSNFCPGSVTFSNTDVANESFVISFEVSEFLKGILLIKSDEQLVVELKTVLGMIAATAVAITLAVVGIKLKIASNHKYVAALNNYKNLLAQPNPDTNELISAFKKSNRWSKIASRSLVKSSGGWYVTAPSATALSMSSNINDISGDVATTKAGIQSTLGTVNSVNTTLGIVHTDLQSVKTNVSTLPTAVDKINSIQADTSDTEMRVGQLSSDVPQIIADLSGVKNILYSIENGVEGVAGSVTGTSSSLDGVASSITNIYNKVVDTNTKVGHLDSSVDSVLNDTYDLKTSLNSVSQQVTSNANVIQSVSNDIQTTASNISSNHSQMMTDIQNIISSLQSVLSNIQSESSTLKTHVTNEAIGITSNVSSAVDLKIAGITTAITLLANLIK